MVRALCLSLALVLSTAASAQTLADLEAAEEAAAVVWGQMPLTQRVVTFVDAKSQGYGVYDERASNVFKAGEPINTYIEPVGYSWKPLGNKFEIGFVIDMLLKDKEGTVITDEKGFFDLKQQSRNEAQEYSLDVALTLTGAPAGVYVVQYTLHDQGSDETSSFEQEFEIAE